jgi:hypothetical protein
LFRRSISFIKKQQHIIMPRAQSEKPRCPTWSANGNDAAQLFREYRFGKYNNKTHYTEIHKDPSRNYKVYSDNSFFGHCKMMSNSFLQWQYLGTGLDTIRFRALVDLDTPPSLLDQGRAQAPLPVQCAPCYVPTIEDADSLEDDSDDGLYTLRGNNSKDEEGDDDDYDTNTMDCGSFAMESVFEYLKFHGKAYAARAPPPREGVPKVINVDARHTRREKMK